MGALKGDALPWLLLCGIIAMTAGQDSTFRYFIEDVNVPANLTNITWAHAVNSIADLEKYLADDTMMLEADISLGTVNGSGPIVPIMAHPPTSNSDLSFQHFITRVIDVNRRGTKKGAKLDFKDIKTVEPCLQLLKSLKNKIDFPVWLNADILRGPKAGTPVNATEFLRLTQHYYKDAMLSLGWTTNYGCLNRNRYEKQHVEEMYNFVSKHNLEVPPTFPVRAGMAAESVDLLINLVASIPHSTLTLWSSASDPVNITKLHDLILEVGNTRVYADLPFDLIEGPGDVCQDGTTDPSDKDNSLPDDNSSNEVDQGPSNRTAPSNFSIGRNDSGIIQPVIDGVNAAPRLLGSPVTLIVACVAFVIVLYRNY